MDNRRDIIISEAKSLTQRETGLTLWKPKHTLPVVGAAAVIWLGKKAIQAVLTRAKNPEIEIPPLRIQKREPVLTSRPQGKPVYRVTYRAYAEWVVHKDE